MSTVERCYELMIDRIESNLVAQQDPADLGMRVNLWRGQLAQSRALSGTLPFKKRHRLGTHGRRLRYDFQMPGIAPLHDEFGYHAGTQWVRLSERDTS